MIISNLQILNSVKSLQYLNEQQLPVKTSFQIASLVKKLNPILETINVEKDRIVQKWASKDSLGEVIRPTDNNGNIVPDQVIITDVEGFKKDMEQLHNINTNIDSPKVNIADLGAVVMSPLMMSDVDWLFEA